MNRILLIGHDGQVGHELKRTLSSLGEVLAPTMESFDLCNSAQIRDYIRSTAPQIIVNAAAYTAVDLAESDDETAMRVNGIAPGILAEEAKQLNALLIHYSTDYVFDGTNNRPYSETDLPNPQGVYGKTKLAGEQAIEKVGGRYFIFRTSWVYGLHGKNFLKTILRVAQEKRELRIVDDQLGCPTWSRLIAEVTAQVLAQQLNQNSNNNDQYGVYHLTSNNYTSWFKFATQFLEMDPMQDKHQYTAVTPITTQEYPTPAKRPMYSVLSTDKLCKSFNLTMPSWEDNLQLALDADAQ
ncbi:dTDP-4-dehydrorhamnose reductase [Pseudomonadota bacterium]